KADAIKQDEAPLQIGKRAAELAKRPAAFPEILATSSRSGKGIPHLRAAIMLLLEQQAGR
ncbi:MAG: YihA family ribosome biogenesis GTP-binding protein, partial [Beijerinckiaceae bacterium]|nr:YihA family ribosome biogenesis GTP-binding protein [Beijerinckiaceae bacterium]